MKRIFCLLSAGMWNHLFWFAFVVHLAAAAERRKPVEVAATGGNDKIGVVTFNGINSPKLRVLQHNATHCSLENTFVRTVSAEFTYPQYSLAKKPKNGFIFSCVDREFRIQRQNGAANPFADVHVFATFIFDFFRKWYDWQLIPAESGLLPLVLSVNYGENTNSAYRISEQVWMNARKTAAPVAILFGSGDRTMHPLSTLDVVAHEMGHVILHVIEAFAQHDGHTRSAQSLAVEESFADMTAFFMEVVFAQEYRSDYSFDHLRPTDWRIGDNVYKTKGLQFRCIDDGRCNGSRDANLLDHVRQFQPFSKSHVASGIFSKVFFLLTESFKNGIWDSYDLFLKTARIRWRRANCTFKQAAEDVLATAEDINRYRGSGQQLNVNMLYNAFEQVGIELQ